MPKNKVEAPKREMTKRQMTHWQRENRIQRFTLWGGIALIAAVIILVVVGLYFSNIRPSQKTVFTVGDTKYSTGYYADAIDFYGTLNYSFMQNYFNSYSEYISYIAQSVGNTIKQNHIYKAAAAELEPSVTVSDDEVKNYLTENKVSSNKASRDATYGILLESKLTDKFSKALPENAEHRAVLAMFVESQSEIDNVTGRINKGETFNSITENESLDTTTKSKAGDLGWVAKGVIPTTLGTPEDTVLDDLVFSPDTKVNVYTQAEDKEKSKDLGYWIIQVVDMKTGEQSGTDNTTSTQYSVNAMLLGSRELALDVQKQLENGADFATLAKEKSQYSGAASDGGILGFIEKGKLGTAVDAVLYPEDPSRMMRKNEIRGPILDTTQSTKGGYWLVNVTGIETKALDGDNRSTLAEIDKNTWKDAAWNEKLSTIVDQTDLENTQWAIQKAIDIYNKR